MQVFGQPQEAVLDLAELLMELVVDLAAEVAINQVVDLAQPIYYQPQQVGIH